MKHRTCTIRRTATRGNVAVGLVTGKVTILDSKIETGPCGETLWGEQRDRGVCGRCSLGWEDEHNKFADDAEREKAVGGRA